VHILKTGDERLLCGLLVHILKTGDERLLCGLLVHILKTGDERLSQSEDHMIFEGPLFLDQIKSFRLLRC
jgi:hypothetical protein